MNAGAGSAKGEIEAVFAAVVVVAVVVVALTGSGVELTRVKWLFWFWEGRGGPVVVGEWLRDRVREEVCRPGDVLPLLPPPLTGVPEGVPEGVPVLPVPVPV